MTDAKLKLASLFGGELMCLARPFGLLSLDLQVSMSGESMGKWAPHTGESPEAKGRVSPVFVVRENDSLRSARATAVKRKRIPVVAETDINLDTLPTMASLETIRDPRLTDWIQISQMEAEVAEQVESLLLQTAGIQTEVDTFHGFMRVWCTAVARPLSVFGGNLFPRRLEWARRAAGGWRLVAVEVLHRTPAKREFQSRCLLAEGDVGFPLACDADPSETGVEILSAVALNHSPEAEVLATRMLVVDPFKAARSISPLAGCLAPGSSFVVCKEVEMTPNQWWRSFVLTPCAVSMPPVPSDIMGGGKTAILHTPSGRVLISATGQRGVEGVCHLNDLLQDVPGDEVSRMVKLPYGYGGALQAASLTTSAPLAEGCVYLRTAT